MKSEILSQFQGSMYELDSLSTFGRGKDKVKRVRRKGAQGLTNALGAVGINKIGGKRLNTKKNRKDNLKVAAATGVGVGGTIGLASLLNRSKMSKSGGKMTDLGTVQKMLPGSKGGALAKTGSSDIVMKGKRNVQKALPTTALGGRRAEVLNTRAVSKKANQLATTSGKKTGELVAKIGNKASKLNLGKIGKIAAGVAAGGALAAGAAKALRNNKKKKR